MINERDSYEFQHTLNLMCCELLAACTSYLFPNVKVLGGYASDVGFWYDFQMKTPLDEMALPIITTEMQRWINQKKRAHRTTMMKENAIAFFQQKKMSALVEKIGKRAETLVELYRIDEFYDLSDCELEELELIKGFFLADIVAVPHAHPEFHTDTCIRISGAAFSNKQDLKAYTKDMVRAKKNNPILFAKEQLLCFTEDEALSDAILAPSGSLVWQLMQVRIREALDNRGYSEIVSCTFSEDVLFRRSGISLFEDGVSKRDDLEAHCLTCDSTMNHIQFLMRYAASRKISYPFRTYEIGQFAKLCRSQLLEPMLETRTALGIREHIFCPKSQLRQELISSLKFILRIVSTLGLDCRLCLVLPRMRQRHSNFTQIIEEIGSHLAQEHGLNCKIMNDSSLYSGPKIEVQAQDLKHRWWSLAFCGIDSDATKYMDAKASVHNAQMLDLVVIVASMLMSFHRALSLMLEKCSGWLPLWLAPMQVQVFSSKEAKNAAKDFMTKLHMNGIRAHLDNAVDSLSTKIYQYRLEKIPYVIVVGKEINDGKISCRDLSKDEDARLVNESVFIEDLIKKLAQKA
jgi:threonyl-tRNA synthetase